MWWWHAGCKTRYASLLSPAHFLQCHLGIIKLLDLARTRGFSVGVRDDGGYPGHRNADRLLAALAEMNRRVAMIAGALADQLDASGVRSDAPIFQHPEFERLEHEGRQSWPSPG